MRAEDIPTSADSHKTMIMMRELLRRGAGSGRFTWLDLPSKPGVYIVAWAGREPLKFGSGTGAAAAADAADPRWLGSKWSQIQQDAASDIIYIGKGDSLRKRVRDLARFGAGRARNHKGGEWMWQVQGVESAVLFMHTCPDGMQVAFENWLLVSFFDAHGAYPLANRKGPDGQSRWHP